MKTLMYDPDHDAAFGKNLNVYSPMTTPNNLPGPTPLSPAAQAVLDASSRAKCIREWRNVNDPPCHPSDLDWQGCATCRGTAIPVAVLCAAADQIAPTKLNYFEESDLLTATCFNGMAYAANELRLIATELRTNA